jgi:hypothetical protein
VAEDSIDPREQIPESDLVDPQAPESPAIPEDLGDADEADWLEQHAPVPNADEDDYSSEAGGAERS